MTSAYQPWDEARGAEIIAEHDKLEGATLVNLHAMQEAFGYVPKPAIPMIASRSVFRGSNPACSHSIMTSVMSPPAATC